MKRIPLLLANDEDIEFSQLLLDIRKIFIIAQDQNGFTSIEYTKN